MAGEKCYCKKKIKKNTNGAHLFYLFFFFLYMEVKAHNIYYSV